MQCVVTVDTYINNQSIMDIFMLEYTYTEHIELSQWFSF